MYEDLISVLRKCSKLGTRYGMAVIYMEQAADAIEELSKQNEKWEDVVKTTLGFIPRWIPVTERLPGKGVRVLVTDGIDVDTSWLFGNPVRWVTAKIDVEDERITHWMPLPVPPEEEQ